MEMRPRPPRADEAALQILANLPQHPERLDCLQTYRALHAIRELLENYAARNWSSSAARLLHTGAAIIALTATRVGESLAYKRDRDEQN